MTHRGLLTAMSIAILFTAGEPKNWKAAKKLSAINLNSSYYQEPFALCKPARQLNPVEQVKAQAVATAIFQRCGSRLIIEFATKYNFPAHAIQLIAKLSCYGLTLVYAFHATEAFSLTIAPDTLSGVIRGLIATLGRFISQFEFTSSYRGHTYIFNGSMYMDYVNILAKCVYNGRFAEHRGDYLLHTVNHFRFIVL